MHKVKTVSWTDSSIYNFNSMNKQPQPPLCVANQIKTLVLYKEVCSKFRFLFLKSLNRQFYNKFLAQKPAFSSLSGCQS